MKQNDGTMKEMQEDEVMFEKTNEYPVTLAISREPLTQATPHNVTMFNKKLLQIEYENINLKDEIISL